MITLPSPVLIVIAALVALFIAVALAMVGVETWRIRRHQKERERKAHILGVRKAPYLRPKPRPSWW